MESIGDTLREARHAKRVSLEDASRATRIKMEIIEQLESDEFDRLAAPAYTKGFLKLYSEYLGLDSQHMVEAYLRSQGGLRRQGLHVETEKKIRARKPAELKLPMKRVGMAVGGLTLLVLLIVLARSRPSHPATIQPIVSASAISVPKADFDAYYQPKTHAPLELVEPAGSK
jgi:cytoskeleton protein RodZ